ncbi:hypothetical protein GOV12_03170 [Candidatus Pacearchaeota archaeon]|nr:hypothetical protein [Candidatus Pacearchaeota archaeon]
MASLEEGLSELHGLRNDLVSVITIREGEGHFEEVEEYETGWNIPTKEEDEWVWDVEPITRPDIDKRDSARFRLSEIYQKSDWHYIRYQAGLFINSDDLNDKILMWVQELKSELNGLVTKYHGIEIKKVPDEKLRMRAMRDAVLLFQRTKSDPIKRLLEDTYKTNDLKIIRKFARNALGYKSSSDIAIDCSMCILGAAALFGAVYYSYKTIFD